MSSNDQIKNTGAAFSAQAPLFDSIEEHNEILKWMRQQIHAHCMKYFRRGEQILELNCGTGIDAVFFAKQGTKVHATDLSAGMINELRKKVAQQNLGEMISVQQCSFTELEKIPTRGFDHIFSDFGGLNCVKEIDAVIAQFETLLKPGGTVTLVIMPPVCPWEMLLALKGNFKTAFRRLKKGGADSHLEGVHFMSHYFSPGKIISCFGKNYSTASQRGLGSVVPPPYLEKFPQKHPALFRRLTALEEKICHTFPFNAWADHFILTMRLDHSGHV
jgi:ubiquinone/menaquinone biosynthesis C-methylase UbiE